MMRVSLVAAILVYDGEECVVLDDARGEVVLADLGPKYGAGP